MVELIEFSSTLMITLVLFVVIVMGVSVVKRRKWGSNESPKHDLESVPGPRKLPLIGNLHLLLRKSPAHHIFRELAAKYGPLMRLQLGEVPFLIVSSVEVAKQVLKTHDVAFANRPPLLVTTTVSYNYTNIGAAPYSEYWRQMRKICTLELLSSRRVTTFQPIREEENSNLAKWIASREGSPINLSESVCLCTFDITTRASIGRKTEEKGRITAAVKQALKLASTLTIADLYPSNTLLPLITGLNFKIQRIFRQTDTILQSIINEHRGAVMAVTDDATLERSEDLVDVLMKHQQDEAQVHLTDDNIKAVMMDMFLAGGETSGTAVDWAMSEMMRNPSTLRRAQEEVREVFDDKGYVDEEKFDELKYLKLVIKETLRLHPPLPLLVPRQSSEGCEINGYEIPAKTRVMINAWALGRDPKYWDDAEMFMPERFEDSSIDFKGNNLEYIPFGAGRRMCPGMAFGLANVEFPLATLLYHFDWKMPNGMKLDMSEELGATVKRKHDLILIPTLMRAIGST